MTGYYSSIISIPLTNLNGTNGMSFSSTGFIDGFVTAFNNAGILSWGSRITGTDRNEEPTGICTYATGITVTGRFSSNMILIYNGKVSDAAPSVLWGTILRKWVCLARWNGYNDSGLR